MSRPTTSAEDHHQHAGATLAATSPWFRMSAMLLSASMLGCATQGVEPGAPGGRAVLRGHGWITDAKAALAEELHACFGGTADPRLVNFYTEGKLAGVSIVRAGAIQRRTS